MRNLFFVAVAALLLTTGFTCSKSENTAQETTPAMQEEAAPPAEQPAAAPADMGQPPAADHAAPPAEGEVGK